LPGAIEAPVAIVSCDEPGAVTGAVLIALGVRVALER
jgi:hypothetical protein